MQLISAAFFAILQLNFLLYDGISIRPLSSSHRVSSLVINAFKRGPYASNVKGPVSKIDGRSVKDGSLVEYISSKGSKRLSIVKRRLGPNLEVLNNALMEFTISISKVTYLIDGFHTFSDLISLTEIISNQKLNQVEEVWNCAVQEPNSIVNTVFVSEKVYGSPDSVHIYASMKLMAQFGSVFFTTVPQDGERDSSSTVLYVPLTSDAVKANLERRAALQEFRAEFNRLITTQASKNGNSIHRTTEMNDQALGILNEFTLGLKQIIGKSHPWVMNGWCTNTFSEEEAAKGKELLDYLELTPSSKNAKKVLELSGIWPVHTNIEKYVMGIRDIFPAEVLEEAKSILQNKDSIPDPDVNIRKDLTHLLCYAIDSEGASEVDDAVSIERLPNGQHQIWTHISDVSRWILPASQLCVEAERRMTSIYHSDEIISMFPPALSSDLLSLGAEEESFALSCGVILNDQGEVISFQVCPSKIKLTHKITYIQLDKILASEDLSAEASLLAAREDLLKLNEWSKLRFNFRKEKKAAFDSYLNQKTELSLSVNLIEAQPVITSELKYGNSSSNCFVTEFMILMCDSVGALCVELNAPVRYKTQSPQSPFEPSLLDLLKDETPFVRASRIVRYLKAASDSKTPGPHCTSGSSSYVQCTSPIRRYHDLFNHYNLKSALHAVHSATSISSDRSEAGSAIAGAGVNGDVVGAVEGSVPMVLKLQTLNAVKMVSRSRSQYWLHLYVKELTAIEPKIEFTCAIIGLTVPDEVKEGTDKGKTTKKPVPRSASNDSSLFDVMVYALGSFQTYKLYCPAAFNPATGKEIRCHLHKIDDKTALSDYVFLPVGFDPQNLPASFTKKNIPSSSNISS